LVVFPQTGNYTLILGLLAVWLILWVFNRHYWYWIPVMAVLSSPWVFLNNSSSSWERLFIPLSLSFLLTISWYVRKKFSTSSEGEIGIDTGVSIV
jgi:hypothetical protein